MSFCPAKTTNTEFVACRAGGRGDKMKSNKIGEVSP